MEPMFPDVGGLVLMERVDRVQAREETGIEEELLAGYAHLDAGAPAEALACFDRALRISPRSPEVRAARAEAFVRMARPLDAAHEYAEATSLDPGCRTYRLEWIENLVRGGAFATASQEAEAAIAAGVDSARVHLLAARARLAGRTAGIAREEAERALEHYEAALDLDPRSRELLLETASLALEMQLLARGLELLERALRNHPEDGELLFALARAKAAALETEQARSLLHRCLDVNENDPWGARTLLEQIEGEEQARRSGAALPAAYVRGLFDQYADRYDDDLRNQLEYRGPEALAELLEPFLTDRVQRSSVTGTGQPPAASSDAGLDVLDLGCGTGLSGIRFRGVARHLEGVDLSPAMIEQAGKRSIYDRLRVGDLRTALLEEQDRWDLILACDVFAYVGELADVFTATERALRSGGRFAATFEDQDGSGVRLKPTRRFGYTPEYLRNALREARLELLILCPVSVRRENGVPVPSHGLVARKAGGDS